MPKATTTSQSVELQMKIHAHLGSAILQETAENNQSIGFHDDILTIVGNTLSPDKIDSHKHHINQQTNQSIEQYSAGLKVLLTQMKV